MKYEKKRDVGANNFSKKMTSCNSKEYRDPSIKVFVDARPRTQ